MQIAISSSRNISRDSYDYLGSINVSSIENIPHDRYSKVLEELGTASSATFELGSAIIIIWLCFCNQKRQFSIFELLRGMQFNSISCYNEIRQLGKCIQSTYRKSRSSLYAADTANYPIYWIDRVLFYSLADNMALYPTGNISRSRNAIVTATWSSFRATNRL